MAAFYLKHRYSEDLDFFSEKEFEPQSIFVFLKSIKNELIKKAKLKFDWHVDPLQLGSQFIQVAAFKDYPRMIKKISPKIWQDFFIKQAKLLNKDIMR